MWIPGYAWKRHLTEFYPQRGISGGCLHVSDFGNFPVNASLKFGSFEGRIEVPENAAPTEYYVQLWKDCGNSGGEFLEYLETFTVGDPRLPTATLEVNVPSWVRCNKRNELFQASVQISRLMVPLKQRHFEVISFTDMHYLQM